MTSCKAAAVHLLTDAETRALVQRLSTRRYRPRVVPTTKRAKLEQAVAEIRAAFKTLLELSDCRGAGGGDVIQIDAFTGARHAE